MSKAETDNLTLVDGIVRFCEGKIPDNGEDADWTAVNERASMAAVFDGAGGSGAKRYRNLRDKTGAYLASRAIAGASRQWFHNLCEANKLHSADSAESLRACFSQALRICSEQGIPQSSSKLRSRLEKAFPSTAAMAVCSTENQRLTVSFYWAGDSRGYILDGDGLHQVTKDDLDVADAMENLSADGVMTNIISASKSFEVHKKTVNPGLPCIILTATDGCFGYFSTPMEFEFALLETLLQSDSLDEWQLRLPEKLGAFAEDDYTLNAIIMGYGSFVNLKNAFIGRANRLYEAFIRKLHGMSMEEKTALWTIYKPEYERYM